ncbi:MAG TPA: stalk domain-containing protein [Armatimonadota bacterium]
MAGPRRIIHIFIAGVFASFVLAALLVHAGAATPKPAQPHRNSKLTGQVQLVTAAPMNGVKFSYAVLYVDTVGRSVTNTLPLRFDIDTTKLTDGPHVFKVVLFDEGGVVKEMVPFTVDIANLPPKRTEPTVTVPTTPSTHAKPAPDTAPAKVTPQPQRPKVMTPRAKSTALTIIFDGQPLDFDLPPFIARQRAMALLRPLVTAAGGSLTWHGDIGTAQVQHHQICFVLGHDNAVVDGKVVTLARPVIRRQSRIFAPVSLWRDLFSGVVEYEHPSRTVRLMRLTNPAALPTTK